jgi:hypothetical protein
LEDVSHSSYGDGYASSHGYQGYGGSYNGSSYSNDAPSVTSGPTLTTSPTASAGGVAAGSGTSGGIPSGYGASGTTSGVGPESGYAGTSDPTSSGITYAIGSDAKSGVGPEAGRPGTPAEPPTYGAPPPGVGGPGNTGNISQINTNKLNAQLADQLRALRETPYLYGGYKSEGVDCSGTIIYALEKMGYSVSRDITANDMATGLVSWINLLPGGVDNDRIGDEGVLNFYKFAELTYIHVNVGVGIRGNEGMRQIIDATEGNTMMNRNDGRAGQYYRAGIGMVNQTYAPLSSKPADAPLAQATIDWAILESFRKR